MLGEIYYATHQLYRFYEDPCCTHGAAIYHLARYFCGNRDDRLILDLNHGKSFEVYADADFCGNWYRPTAINEP